MRFRHKPIEMEAVQWDGELSTVPHIVALGVDFRITDRRIAKGMVRVGFVIVNRSRDKRIVDLGHWVAKGPDGFARILSPQEMQNWRPVHSAPKVTHNGQTIDDRRAATTEDMP